MSQENTGLMILDVEKMTALNTFSQAMAEGQVCVPQHLRGKPADCLAVAMQAAQWGMNPFAVAQKTHIVSGNLGYESQLVNAVISSSTAIKGRFHYESKGNWESFSPGNKNTEQGLAVRVGAILNGEDEITWGDWVYLNLITTRNSPLWKTNPAQQLKYLALKYWARLYTPDVIMGVYDKEELEAISKPERDITDAVNSINDSIDAEAANEEPVKEKPATKPKSTARPKPTPKPKEEAQKDIDKGDGKVIEGEFIDNVQAGVDELNSNQTKENGIDEDASAFHQLHEQAVNIKGGTDYKKVWGDLVAAHNAGLVTNAEANKVKASLTASKNALMAK